MQVFVEADQTNYQNFAPKIPVVNNSPVKKQVKFTDKWSPESIKITNNTRPMHHNNVKKHEKKHEHKEMAAGFAQNIETNKQVDFIFRTNDKEEKPYHEDGDYKMYT